MKSNAMQETHDTRIFRRHDVRAEAKVEPLEEMSHLGTPTGVMLQDISRTGVMFRIDNAVEPKTMWRLRIIESGHALDRVFGPQSEDVTFVAPEV